MPPLGLTGLDGASADELVDQGPLSRPGSKQASNSLNVLSLALRPSYDDGDIGLRNIDALVEHARGHEDTERTVLKTG